MSDTSTALSASLARGIIAAILIAAPAAGLAGCGAIRGCGATSAQLRPAPAAPATSAASSAATTGTSATASEPPLVEEFPPPPGHPSEIALSWASELGGKSQKDRTLYFVIGATLTSEVAAREKLQAAQPLFGDMQTYFIIQRSENLSGLRPGYWVIVEAYADKANATREIVVGKRAFPDAYIEAAKVLTDDPIPVYEEALD